MAGDSLSCVNVLNKKQGQRLFEHLYNLLHLRTGSILVQVVLIAGAHFWLGYQFPIVILAIIIGAESVFNLGCYLRTTVGLSPTPVSLTLQILADILFLTLVLFFTGGSTNPFVSLLLLPVAIAAVILPIRSLLVVIATAFLAYSVLILVLPQTPIMIEMGRHYVGMWINFVISALVISTFLVAMARTVKRREHAIAVYREEQLRQEQLIALGTASAQITHELATPIATMQLLYDELREQMPESSLCRDLGDQLDRCSMTLEQFRQIAEHVRNPVFKSLAVSKILRQLQDLCRLSQPETIFNINTSGDLTSKHIETDMTLVPALLNLVQNAAKASVSNGSHQIDLSVSVNEQQAIFIIRDYGHGIDSELLKGLGEQTVKSEQGLGVAVFLSNATLERLGGRLELSNLDIGVQAKVTLPSVSAGLL